MRGSPEGLNTRSSGCVCLRVLMGKFGRFVGNRDGKIAPCSVGNLGGQVAIGIDGQSGGLLGYRSSGQLVGGDEKCEELTADKNII